MKRGLAQRAFDAANKHRIHTRSANESPATCNACADEEQACAPNVNREKHVDSVDGATITIPNTAERK